MEGAALEESQTINLAPLAPLDSSQTAGVTEQVPSQNTQQGTAQQSSTTSELTVEDYSDKSFVVRGEKTRDFKDNLRTLGGKFNRNLRGGAAWIFPKTKQETVVDFVMQVNSGEVSSALPGITSDAGLPTVPNPNVRSNPYQYVKYKIYKPREGMKATLTTNGKTMEGRVVKTEINNNVVDTAYVEFDGQRSLAITGRGRWEISGLFSKHTLFFSE